MPQRDKCPYCFGSLPAEADVCLACGQSSAEDPSAPRKGYTKLVAGIVVGVAVLISWHQLPGIAAILIPHLQQARKEEGEVMVLGDLKTISVAQSLFREMDKEQDGVLDYGTLDELAAAGLLDSVLSAGTKTGYVFSVAPSPIDPVNRWMAVANPVVPGKTGDRSFAVNQEGTIYYSEGQLLTLNDECEIPEGLSPVWPSSPAGR